MSSGKNYNGMRLIIKLRNYRIESSDFYLGASFEKEVKQRAGSILLGCEVDLIIFSQANLRLQHQIIRGELIIGKDNIQRVRREQRALDQYLDMRYFYEMYEKGLGKGF